MLKNRLILIIFVIIPIILLILFPSIDSYFNYGLENGYRYFKGADKPDSNIIIIHISANDIKNLGGWPLKRSYYALLLEKLSDLKVKKVGLEIFLSENYSAQEIYNSVLVNAIEGKDRSP